MKPRLLSTALLVCAVMLLAGCGDSNYQWGWYVFNPAMPKGQTNIQFMLAGLGLTITLSIVCKNGASGSFTLVNKNPGVPVSPGAPVAGPTPPAPESQISEQQHDLSRSCAEAKGELLRDITDNMLGLSFQVATPGKLEATVVSGASAPAATAPGTLGCETVFSARTAGPASVGRAVQTVTVAKLSQAFKSVRASSTSLLAAARA